MLQILIRQHSMINEFIDVNYIAIKIFDAIENDCQLEK